MIKKNYQKFLYILVVLALLFFLLPLFRSEVFLSHDGETQLIRMASYYSQLSEAVFPVRWAPNFNYGYGNPIFIFVYPLPYLLGSFFHAIGFSFQDAYKILMGGSFVLSFYFFYLWIRQNFSEVSSVIAGLIYVLAPHHFLDFYVRGAIGDMFGFVFIPLCLYSIEKVLKGKTIFVFIGIISYSLLILSHNGLSLIFTPIIIGYSLIKALSVKKIRYPVLLIFPIGLLLSLFFWAPALIEQKFIATLSIFENNYINHFPNLSSLIYAQWGFGVDVNKEGGLSPQIGIINLLVLITSIFFIKKISTINKRLLIFWVGVFLFYTFLSISFSAFFYQNISFLREFQFPWRFLAASGFACAAVSPLVFERIKIKNAFLIIIAIIFVSMPFSSVKGYFSHHDSYYSSFSGLGYDHGEGTTIWVAGDASKKVNNKVEIVEGRGRIIEMLQGSLKHQTTVQAETDVLVLDNTVYFPGWKVFVDGKKTPIEFQDINRRGLITFPVEKGVHKVEVIFGDSPIRFVSNMISLISFLLFVIALLVYYFFLRKKISREKE